jgi:[NiFe] hydrogenase diaphorase moiety small subunit
MIHHITIDGSKVRFKPGDTIMEAAIAAGIYIPHLCHNPELVPHGSCRLCTVSNNGRHVAACTTPAVSGAVIDNNNTDLMALRRKLLQMLFVEGNHICPACEKSGNCQLQAVAYHCGMLAPEYTHLYPTRSIDASHPEIALEYNRCILCAQCVRASRDIDKKSVFAISGRGIKSHLVINSSSGLLANSTFSSNDYAARVCPVGAIIPKHKCYDVPIGKRLYDKKPVSMIGDVSDHNGEHRGK